MKGILYIIGFATLALPVWAGETIVLKTGFRISAERHELNDGSIRIYSEGGVTEMASALVAAVEDVESPAPEPVADLPKPVSLPEPPPVKTDSSPAVLAQSAARKYALPDAFVAGVMRAESGFNPTAVSPKGAIGLMQLMPGTARELGADPKRPEQNADAGARYLRDLLARYEDRPDQVVLALAAYNAGTAAVEKYHGVPPYRETREYILRVLKNWNPPVVPVVAATGAR